MADFKKVPNKFLDRLIAHLQVKNDRQLSIAMGTTAPAISKIRHGTLPIGPAIIITAHEVTGLSIRELKRIAGLESAKSIVPNEA